MPKGLKKLVFWAVILTCGYFVLSNHFIFIGSSPHILKKSRLTLEYTIFSTQGKTIESIMNVDDLRNDGIGELLVKNPEEVIRKAVKGMLPKNKLARHMIKKLKVYTGSAHPHDAQQPKALSL